MDDSDIMQRICAVVLDPTHVDVRVESAGQHVGRGGFHSPATRNRAFDLDYFVDGEADFVVNGRRFRARRGEMVLRFPGDRVSADFPVPLSAYHSHFDLPGAERRILHLGEPRDARALADHLHDPAALLLPDHIAPAAQGRTVELLDAMAADWTRPVHGASARCASHLLLLLDHLSTEAERALSPTGQAPAPTQHHHVTRALRLIEGRLHNRISLAEVARGVHVSADHLSRVFRSQVGETVGRYIRTRRIERAKGLLIGSPLSIKEIAVRVGIADQLYFCRLFKRAVGVSPSEFRAGHRAAPVRMRAQR